MTERSAETQAIGSSGITGIVLRMTTEHAPRVGDAVLLGDVPGQVKSISGRPGWWHLDVELDVVPPVTMGRMLHWIEESLPVVPRPRQRMVSAEQEPTAVKRGE